VGLIVRDPDGNEPVGILRLQEHDVLPGEDVHAHRLDRAQHEARTRG
jgi:hypothetical protein